MTVAIGIHTINGIVVCADSQYSSSFKANGQKVFSWCDAGVAVVFAIAGDVANATMAVQECCEVLNLNASARSLPKVKKIIQLVIKEIQEKYVDKIPLNEREAARFTLIVGIATKDHDPCLYYTSETGAMVRFDEYHSIGSGGYLAGYVLSAAYDSNMQVDEASACAAYALAAAKRHDSECSGPSQFVTIRQITRRGGYMLSVVVPFDLESMEKGMLQYERMAMGMLLEAGNFALSEEYFKERVDKFAWRVREMRKEFKRNGVPHKTLLSQLVATTRSPSTSRKSRRAR